MKAFLDAIYTYPWTTLFVATLIVWILDALRKAIHGQ